MKREKLALYGLVMSLIGIASYLLGVLIAIPRRLIFGTEYLLQVNEALVWYSGIPVLFGISLILIDLFVLYPKKRTNELITYRPIENNFVTVVLTAYNDEYSIKAAVSDFKTHPLVKRVLVISNNSTDNTLAWATQAGAIACQAWRCRWRAQIAGRNANGRPRRASPDIADGCPDPAQRRFRQERLCRAGKRHQALPAQLRAAL